MTNRAWAGRRLAGAWSGGVGEDVEIQAGGRAGAVGGERADRFWIGRQPDGYELFRWIRSRAADSMLTASGGIKR
jgi:hypothetical protein